VAVRPVRLAALAERVGGLVEAPPDRPAGAPPVGELAITGATHDSRAVRPGDLYAALPGLSVHGARFAGDAARSGALAVLTDPVGAGLARPARLPMVVVDRPREVLGAVAAMVYGDPSRDLAVYGVTGTNGKTTTAYLLEAGLRAAGRRTGLLGTVETRVAGRAVPSERTTPEATDLQAGLALMREQRVDAVAMEVSSHALALGRVEALCFAAGLFTNLSQDHLDFHGGLEEYFRAKALLFDGRCAVEVVNVDDPYGRRLLHPGTVTVSLAGGAGGGPPAAWWADELAADGGGTAFRLHGPDVDRPARVASPGGFTVANAVLALAALASTGVPVADALPGVAETVVPGRMEAVEAGQSFRVVVDYAHTPSAVAAALAALRPLTAGRLIVVLGCGGDRDPGKRPLMGEAAARGADLLVITDDNPRSEDPGDIRAAMAAGAARVPGAQWLAVPDREAALAEALRQAGPQDTVLVAGKGHEQGQEAAGVVHPFDDRAVLRTLLGEA